MENLRRKTFSLNKKISEVDSRYVELYGVLKACITICAGCSLHTRFPKVLKRPFEQKIQNMQILRSLKETKSMAKSLKSLVKCLRLRCVLV